jgi:restriction system protein
MDEQRTILDYSAFIEDRKEGYDSEIFEKYTSYSEPKYPSLFFSKRGWCPFCQSAASHPAEKKVGIETDDPLRTDWMETNVWFCTNCGWWEIAHYEQSYADFLGQWSYSILRHGILKSFDVSNVDLPVGILRNQLAKTPDLIRQIHPVKMEQLVQSVFADFFDCEVEHCGRSHDNGIDLVVVQSDCPIVIQVKRREKAGSVESVGIVRDFLGAMLLKGYRHGVIVTTAHHFSREAKSAVELALTRDLVDTIYLVDVKRLLDILHLFRHDTTDPWCKYLPTYSALGCADQINNEGFNTVGSRIDLRKLLGKITK